MHYDGQPTRRPPVYVAWAKPGAGPGAARPGRNGLCRHQQKGVRRARIPHRAPLRGNPAPRLQAAVFHHSPLPLYRLLPASFIPVTP